MSRRKQPQPARAPDGHDDDGCSAHFPCLTEPFSASPTSSPDEASASGALPSNNVTLEILHSTRVAVAQFSQGADEAFPVLLDHLMALQQQQVHQLRLIQQLCSQVAFLNRQPDASVSSNPPEAKSDVAFFKHKCGFCSKAFGSDSALQIHLRSHTGERPFKCNVCGNRFSTKGNLKVHFQRHRERFPHVRMNPFPVPEYLDDVPASSGIPYGMETPETLKLQRLVENIDKKLADARTESPARDFGEEPSMENHGFAVDYLKPESFIDPHRTQDSCPGVPTTTANRNTQDQPMESVKQEDLSPSEDESPPLNLPAVNELGVKEETQTEGFQTRDEGPATILSATPSFCFGVGSLLSSAPSRRTARQHNCNMCGKNFSSASALQIHERTHTGEKPYVCTVCGRAFTTKGNLKVHMGTHMWNNAPARRGRRLSVENPTAMKFSRMFQEDLALRAVEPSFWNRYAAAVTGSLANGNEISVIQGGGGYAQPRPLCHARAELR